MKTIGYCVTITYIRRCCRRGMRMDQADRGINETLLSSVNELVQRRCVPLSIYHDHSPPHPSFRLNEHKQFYSPRRPSIVTWFLSEEEIRSSFKKRSAEQSYIDLDYSVFLICCQSATWYSFLFCAIKTEMEYGWQSFPSLTYPSLKSTRCLQSQAFS